jgi:hypothetical protein
MSVLVQLGDPARIFYSPGDDPVAAIEVALLDLKRRYSREQYLDYIQLLRDMLGRELDAGSTNS